MYGLFVFCCKKYDTFLVSFGFRHSVVVVFCFFRTPETCVRVLFALFSCELVVSTSCFGIISALCSSLVFFFIHFFHFFVSWSKMSISTEINIELPIPLMRYLFRILAYCCCCFLYYFNKISKIALPGVMLKYNGSQ